MITWLRAIWHRYFCTCAQRWMADPGEERAAFLLSGLPLNVWVHLNRADRGSAVAAARTVEDR